MTIISQFLHFDSSSATQIYDSNNTTGNFLNPYKALFPMNQSFRNIKRVYLRSCELPVGFPNIRKGSTDTIIMKINGTIYSITLPERNHQTISTLLTDINALTNGGFGGVIPTFSVTSSLLTPYRFVVNFTGTTCTTFNFIDTSLSKNILGFRSTDPLSGGVVCNSSCNYNLSADNYILMHIPSFNSLNASMNGAVSTFKINLQGFTNSVFFYMDNNSFHQFVEITDSNLVLSGLQVVMYDKYGKNLQPYGLDYSFTIEIQYVV